MAMTLPRSQSHHQSLHHRQPPISGADLAWLEQQADHIQVAAEHELRMAGAGGLSELELIRALQGARWRLVGPVSFADPTALYPVHFLLFHALYRLQEQLAHGGEHLEIAPLRLKLASTGPASASRALPAEQDRLRLFYLDLSRYFMSDGDIQRMMASFHSGAPAVHSQPGDVESAARVLGYTALPPTFTDIKRRFRKRVMQVHPDRGGNTEDIQELNRAFSVLKSHYAQLSSHV